MKTSATRVLGATASAAIIAGTLTKGRVYGANERIRVGIVGMRSRGNFHMNRLAKTEQVEVAAICDVDGVVLKARADEFEKNYEKRPKTYSDIREMLADDSIDAIFVATPNHWHTLAAVWACEAGKDVYVEKPVSQTVWEGRQLVAAGKKTGRIIQVGTQRRSNPRWQRVVERLRAGVIGDIYMSRIIIFNPRGSIGIEPDQAPPAHLNWPLWQGPAPEKPFSKNYVHYNWHWFWHYGSGEFGNNGVHYADIVNWAIDKGLPTRVHSIGGRFGYKDRAETPNTQVSTFTYADGTMFECDIRGLYSNKEGGAGMANLFYGSEGHVVDGRFYDNAGKEIPDENPPKGGDDVALHVQNFFDAVRSRDAESIHAKPIDGHIAAAHCHLGNISYRLGRDLEFVPEQEQFKKDKEADALLTRTYREGFAVPKLA